MGRFLRNSALILLPFLLVMAIEVFVLPIDYFCVRSVEAIIVYALQKHLPGPFYPNYRIEREEVGNLAAHTPYAVSRPSLWIIDRYGFRYDPATYRGDDFDIVIVGDSLIEGGGLTQSEMLNTLLAQDFGFRVYPFASLSLNDFLHDPRFIQHPPKLVIEARTELGLTGLPDVHPGSFERHAPYTSQWIQGGWVVLDRLLKSTLLNYSKTKARQELKSLYLKLKGKTDATRTLSSYAFLGTDGKTLFQTAELRIKDTTDQHLDHLINCLDHHRQAVEQRGMRYMFFTVPNKSSIYYDRVPLSGPPDFIPRLIKAARNRGITVLDTQSAYLDYRKANPQTELYQWDDTHWSARGVEVIADKLQPLILRAFGRRTQHGS